MSYRIHSLFYNLCIIQSLYYVFNEKTEALSIEMLLRSNTTSIHTGITAKITYIHFSGIQAFHCTSKWHTRQGPLLLTYRWQDCSISIANALEILQSRTKPSIYVYQLGLWHGGVIPGFLYNVTCHPYPNFNKGLAKPPEKLRHGCVNICLFLTCLNCFSWWCINFRSPNFNPISF